MTAEKEFLCHGRMIVSTLVYHTPTHIGVNLSFAASQRASPVHFLTVTAGADLGVPVG
jgi:hypothetical protein